MVRRHNTQRSSRSLLPRTALQTHYALFTSLKSFVASYYYVSHARVLPLKHTPSIAINGDRAKCKTNAAPTYAQICNHAHMHPLLLAFRLKRNGTHNHVMKMNLQCDLYTRYKPFCLLNETTLPSSASLLCAYVLQNAARNHNAEKRRRHTASVNQRRHDFKRCLRLFFHLLQIQYSLAPCPSTQLIGAAENQPSTRSIRNSGQCA